MEGAKTKHSLTLQLCTWVCEGQDANELCIGITGWVFPDVLMSEYAWSGLTKLNKVGPGGDFVWGLLAFCARKQVQVSDQCVPGNQNAWIHPTLPHTRLCAPAQALYIFLSFKCKRESQSAHSPTVAMRIKWDNACKDFTMVGSYINVLQLL